MICVMGGLAGVLLGVMGAWLVSQFAEITVVVTLNSIGISFLFAAATGIFFGFYPARKAAYLKRRIQG
ncbi:hypothetical protein EDC63_1201 [Sulfurirhabdus autotrophica]|uniref:Uncharacterized protein n=2 Tax=Sulfurirhabdus autotrophica TaxID=1706046 RepID=A0A4R3XUE7_9PROT|nr:hypothetical protein EDC63_1201 [Sulfurirhabdus autotrophica]